MAAHANLEIVYPESAQQALDLAPRVHGAEVRWATPEFVAAAPQLRWVQATSAGVDRYLANEALMEDERIVFTNMQGMHGPTIADHVFGMLLVSARRRVFPKETQTSEVWRKRVSWNARYHSRRHLTESIICMLHSE